MERGCTPTLCASTIPRFYVKLHEMKCVVDTNIINWLVKGFLTLEGLPSDAEFIATHVQIDELNKTPDSELRDKLLQKFAIIINLVVPTESIVIGVSRLDRGKLSDGVLYSALKADLDALEEKPNNKQDALIAEGAIVNGYTLITADRHLAEVAKKQDCKVIYIQKQL